MGILVRYECGKDSVEGIGPSKFMLTCNGSYFYNCPSSKFRGLFFPVFKDNHDWTLFKTIDSINIDGMKKIIHHMDRIEVVCEKGTLAFSFENNTLIIDCDYSGNLIFTLDMREIYDYDDKGRIYSVKTEKGLVKVEYKKFWDSMLESMNYTKNLFIKTGAKVDILSSWRLQPYSEDAKRKSDPSSLFVYDAFRLTLAGKERILISENQEEKRYERKKIPKKTDLAYQLSLKSLYDLYVERENRGFYAGLPWFFQFWTRDEAISMKALLIEKEYDLVRDLLLKRLDMMVDGKVPNRFPLSNLSTADGTGFVFLRLHELYAMIAEKKEQYLSRPQLDGIRAKLKWVIESHKELLEKNGPLETWMDTSFRDDTREGYRIEIQALWLRMLRFYNELAKDLGQKPDYAFEADVKRKVKETFFHEGKLKDGSADDTVRPNIFLAYYIYPDLLEKSEWEHVFDDALPKLWLDWGGLATIDRSSQLFLGEYTGEDNKSYHRGDSWYFINNLAAVSLIRQNKAKYLNHIMKIIEASEKDLLWQGIIGRNSEISCANYQAASASLMQLWSSATLIELKWEYKKG
ncbi:MAG: hypothetical protein NDI94_03465 [Candidatus Woesearchaeota archaeon]|nr:hypothetical protein [Candidatus Woesearchaeota archaeon]